ncbi:tail fiber assembly protein [Erwinia rhapontici]|uniref:tail fiber assembly protein n=1 Tax=Erwinia rhapontici TaxID=55212 RepID=UPI0014383538|nr:tail fiber assembly protein [Erwinia rhapontici]NKG30434.1 tail fiber assembly protein [Erwinia rhapontici]
MIIYVSTHDYRSYGFSPDLWEGAVIPVEVPEEFSGGNMTYDPGADTWIVDVPAKWDYVGEANSKKQELTALFWSETENWRLDLQLGDISEADSDSLKLWVAWRKAVEAVDTSIASEETPVEFPVFPV